MRSSRSPTTGSAARTRRRVGPARSRRPCRGPARAARRRQPGRGWHARSHRDPVLTVMRPAIAAVALIRPRGHRCSSSRGGFGPDAVALEALPLVVRRFDDASARRAQLRLLPVPLRRVDERRDVADDPAAAIPDRGGRDLGRDPCAVAPQADRLEDRVRDSERCLLRMSRAGSSRHVCQRRRFSARSICLFASRSAIRRRLSSRSRPRARATSSLMRPSLKYRRVGTSVSPFSRTLP